MGGDGLQGPCGGTEASYILGVVVVILAYTLVKILSNVIVITDAFYCVDVVPPESGQQEASKSAQGTLDTVGVHDLTRQSHEQTQQQETDLSLHNVSKVGQTTEEVLGVTTYWVWGLGLLLG